MRASSLFRRVRSVRRAALPFIAASGLFAMALTAWAIVGGDELTIVRQVHPAVHVKTVQNELNDLVMAGKNAQAFVLAFERGDGIFGAAFNAVDGSGVNVGNGERYSHVPRPDLSGPAQWATHLPPRVTGPNATSCAECHNTPVEDGAGRPSANVHRDPQRTAAPGRFIQRNTPHLFGSGGLQRLAEEMTDDLRAQATAAILGCGTVGCSVVVNLASKGISFGTVIITRTAVDPTLPPNNCSGTDAIPFIDPADCLAGVGADITGLAGVARDLVVRPFQWKGSVAFVRDFNRDASNQEIGMQAVEIAGDNVDGDFDGVINELGVGDQSVLALYIAAQPRPTTRQELSRLGLLVPPLTSGENVAIAYGEAHFKAIGCADCHVPALTINLATFSEPSRNVNFRDLRFPAGRDPLASGLDPARAVTFDLTADQPDNRIVVGGKEIRFGAFEKGPHGGTAIVRLYGDLKRHDMGPRLAEQIDEIGSGASVWLTENLWGVGSTAPYLHDGRATTLVEAILEHGGEAQVSRDKFAALTASQKKDVVTFLNNLVDFVVQTP
jgi:Di-haem oxidoreductase, putative peroxidase